MQVRTRCSIYTWEQAFATLGAAAALIRGPFADAALGTLGTSHGAAGAAALAGGAFAGATIGTGATSGSGALRVHCEPSWGQRSKSVTKKRFLG